MSPRLAFALNAAHRAARSTLGWFQGGPAIERKADASPVTIADREAERFIRKEIAASYPDDGVLGEEAGAHGPQDHRWVIDPIDGTKSFVAGVPLYATLLGYEVDGKPVLGVCVFPALGEVLYAEAGEGAFWNGIPCRVSPAGNLPEAVIVCGSHASMASRGRTEGLLLLAEEALATRTWGDAYGHALVATGRAAAMLDPVVARWDVSAMAIIVREAGGRFTNFASEDGIFDEAVSSNGVLHDRVLEAFRR
jgi:histidinol phosphatase-like enzyme (inositol monophosphatase family)